MMKVLLLLLLLLLHYILKKKNKEFYFIEPKKPNFSKKSLHILNRVAIVMSIQISLINTACCILTNLCYYF